MSKKKQLWKKGDVFLIPLSDNTFSVGQVINQYKDALNSVVCSFFYIKVKNKEQDIYIDPENLLSILFTTTDLLDSSNWLVIKNQEPLSINSFFNMQKIESNGFVGVKVIGSGIVIKFIEACFGLYPWDGFYEPNYLDKLLISPEKKPKTIIFKE